MKAVEVIMNLPTSKLNTAYTYSVPGELLRDATFGKRVLVDFAGRKVEAFIVEEIENCHLPGIKPIHKVLDVEAVFDRTLLGLARWMAEYYLCPLSLAISIMIPRILHQKRGEILIPAINKDEFKTLNESGITLSQELFNILWERGEMPLRRALNYVLQNELDDLIKNGYVIRTTVYRMGREYKKASVYSLGVFDVEKDLPVLKRKAPRQAEAMEHLLQGYELEREYLDKVVSPGVMQALMKKGYVITYRKESCMQNTGIELNDEQQLAVKQVQKGLHNRKYMQLLLFGVTGSGKTEVYLRSAELALAQGNGVIILVPEIALTRQFVDVFASRIRPMAVLHSGLSAGERYNEWRRIKSGEARVVLGARSAIFAPVKDLGLIIIDEEQEGSFKQEEMPRYHAREVAEQRARLEEVVLLSGSATPSIETYHRAMQGEGKLLVLKKRVGGGRMPRVLIEDLKRSFKDEARRLISPLLREKIRQNLNRGEQVILFINRRGYSPMTICWECGKMAACPFCSVGMTYHRDINQNICHYCNSISMPEKECQYCGSHHLQMIGAGTQKVEEEVRELFPQARIERMDLDSSRRKGVQKSILDRMKGRDIDILIGTQMVAKGLDFPSVSLVGIVDADSILNLPDFRAGERCFQLLVQAAGRAGRSNDEGEVVIQTFNPDNPVIKLAACQDYHDFYRQEIRIRKLLVYPPFTQLLRLVLASEIETEVQDFAAATFDYIDEMIDAHEEEITVLGPAPCPIYKVRNRYRYQIITKCSSLSLLHSIAGYILTNGVPKNVKIEIDFNPIATL